MFPVLSIVTRVIDYFACPVPVRIVQANYCAFVDQDAPKQMFTLPINRGAISSTGVCNSLCIIATITNKGGNCILQ